MHSAFSEFWVKESVENVTKPPGVALAVCESEPQPLTVAVTETEPTPGV